MSTGFQLKVRLGIARRHLNLLQARQQGIASFPLMIGGPDGSHCVEGAFSRTDGELKNLALPRFEDGAEAPSFSLESKRALEKAERDPFASIIREFRAFLFPRDVAEAYNSAFAAADNFLAAMVKEFSL